MNRRWRALAALLLALLLAAGSAFAADYNKLKYGSRGADVLRLQQALVQLGYNAGTADGKFGAYTENAVRAFQRTNGLKVDGIAGSATQTLLYGIVSGAAAAPVPQATAVPQITQAPSGTADRFGGDYATLRYGSTGARVRILQTALNDAGYGRLTADGKFGTGTLTAVMAFQRANGLTADGLAGRATLTKLEAVLGSAASAQPVVTAAPTAAPTPAPTAAPSGFTVPQSTLYPGSSGNDVIQVQTRLKALGYYSGVIDGKYGSGTAAAVMSFQAANGLKADGIAGAKTFARLFAADQLPPVQVTAAPATMPPVLITAAPSGSYAILKKGSSGADVRRLQGALALLDYKTTTYGAYDNQTAAAVKDFQQRNGLTADGIAGADTQSRLYSGSAVRGGNSAGIPDGTGAMTAPAVSQLALLHWYNDVKPSMRSGQNVLIYDPATGLSWKLYLMSLGRHADVEPLTATDTAIQYRAFGNMNDWGPKPVYVLLPDGRWTIAGLSNVPHNTQTIKTNNFNGQNCLHFLRDMAETQQMDPKTGVANQNTIRAFWKELTGQEVTD